MATMGDIAMTHRPQSRSTLRKNPYLSKWNILFDKINSQWISFKPQEGHKVYPCYSCRDMFGSKSSFIDHVNRRGMFITYRCPQCCLGNTAAATSVFRFYNPCSFLLHVRKHFTAMTGSLDLEQVTIATLPIELAGFFPHPSVPLIYDVQEDEIVNNIIVNTRFYSPIPSNMGQRIVNLMPNVLLFQYSASGDKGPVSLILKAISTNIPRCQFVVLDCTNKVILSNSGNGVGATNGYQAILPAPSIGHQTKQIINNNNAKQNANVVVEVKEEPISSTTEDEDAETHDRNQGEGQEEEEEDEFLEKTFEETTQPILKKQLTATNRNMSKYPVCTECNRQITGKMLEHMIGGNRPCNDRLKCVTCNYVAPTQCSLTAHKRIHLFKAPFTCPECGGRFRNDVDLMEHLDSICFHMAKQVRFRCNGRNCGKVFAQSVTFSSHFMSHMPSVFKCMVCSEFFFDEMDFSIHANLHEEYHPPGTFYKCLVCKETGVTYTAENYMEHINWHCTDPAHRVYVFICKYCKSYFRSTQTYAVHLMRCTKKTDDIVTWQSSNGSVASQNIARYSGPNRGGLVNKGGQMVGRNRHHPEDTVTVLMEDSKSDIVRCIQCRETCTLDALVEHMQHCKARQATYQSANGSTATRSFGRQINGDTNTQKSHNKNLVHRSSSIGAEKRRKRPATSAAHSSPSKAKKNAPERNGLQGVNLRPTVFDGTYACKICDYKNTSRSEFREHIIGHRHVSTAYQCMECGECFLVKPSLMKHLRYFHQIADTDSYLTENDCCDQEAVTELVASINRGSSDKEALQLSKEPLNENQCRVCRLQCDNEQELNKHFRVHGMAFITNSTTNTQSTKASTNSGTT